MPRFRSSHAATNQRYAGQHRFEHWYRDNTIYFITARCRDRFPAFATDPAKEVFWNRFWYCARQYGFTPFVTTLLDNHYHTIGYLRIGLKLGPMMQRIHGSVAKGVNDLLPQRLTPFWRDQHHHDYFDGCIRDVLQMRRAYRYVQMQSVRHGICSDWTRYSHTRLQVSVESAVKQAVELKAFLEDVPYARYEWNERRKKR